MKLHFSYLSDQLPSFLTLLDNGPCHKNYPFLWEESRIAICLPFCFPKEYTGCQMNCLLFPSAICGDLVYSRQNSYSNLSYQEIFLPSFAFMLQK
jgi:hypothetical protein